MKHKNFIPRVMSFYQIFYVHAVHEFKATGLNKFCMMSVINII